MVDFAIERTGDRALGLHWAESVTLHTFAPVSLTLMHSVSLRQVFELVQQYERLFYDHRFFTLSERGSQAFLRFTEWPMRSMNARRFVSDMAAACFATVIRKLHGGRIDRISFSHGEPDYVDEYHRVLEMRPCFGEAFTEIVFERAALDRENPHSDDEVRAALGSVLERRIVRATKDAPYGMRVREVLSRHLPRRLNLQTVARKLGLSERSLRRHLAAEGISFRAILHSVCADLAIRMLRDKGWTIQETAHALRFANASTFHRAFRQWTGKTPQSFRERR
jgi:AraC-like DNA-binding protein